MSPRFVLGRENVPCVAEVANRSIKADCTDLKNIGTFTGPFIGPYASARTSSQPIRSQNSSVFQSVCNDDIVFHPGVS